MSSLKQIFYDCQRTTASHPKLIKQLNKIYFKSDLNEFVSEFTCLLKRSLIHGEKQPAVERTLNFVAKFATSIKDDQKSGNVNEKSEKDENDEDDEADQFLVHLIKYLLNNHEANSQAVRFRLCQLINKLLNQMGEEAVIDDDLYSSIYDTMLHRLQDKVPGVRVQAVLALARLQDPRNKKCPVIKAYRYHLSMDPNPDVRRAVLTSAAITFQTLPDILDRTRDVRDTVRREAYKVLSQKVHIRSLTIAQRVRLISEGLKDRSDMVRTTVEKSLLQSWLRMVNGNVLDLLACLDVEASVDEAELALKTMYRDVPFSDLINNFGLLEVEHIVEPSELRPESALYWRCLAQHLAGEGADEALETVIPELTKFCSYLHDYAVTEVKDTGDPQEMAVQSMEREFVTSQLITMTLLYDLSDEVGRRSLDKLVRDLLMSDKLVDSMVKGLVEVFGKLHPPTTRVNQLAEIISEVREPKNKTDEVQPISDEEQRKKKLQAARIRVRMNQIREEIEESIHALDFSKAQLLKEELEEMETELSLIHLGATTTEEVQTQEELSDPMTLRRCLLIVCHMIENPDVTEMTPTLYSLHENLILPCLRSEDPAVRNQAVKALGLLCLLSFDLAKQHLVLFLQISRIDVEQIQLSALLCLIDILHMYGLEEFPEAAEDIHEVNELSLHSNGKEREDIEIDEEGGVIISALCQMMESKCVEVRTHAAEGLCKLLLASRITSSKLLSHLILMWYNPATEDDSLLRHMLGVFFPLYASYGGSNQESLCAAVLPTLQTLFNAPSRSPLSDVDVKDVANFLISITSPAFVTGDSIEQVNTHDTLVFTLCSDILANPESSHTKILIRCLTQLNLTPTNFSTLRQVKVLADKMNKRVRERVCQISLLRFAAMIGKFLVNAPEQTTEESNDDMVTIFSESICVSEPAISPNRMNDTTMIRKKRMLYNQTNSDLDLFSSEEVEAEEPMVDPETCTQTEDSEVEMSPKNVEGEDTTSLDSKKRSKEECSASLDELSSEEAKTPSKMLRTVRDVTSGNNLNLKKSKSRRRTKKHIAHSEESSEGEAAVPSKISRIGRPSDSVLEESNSNSVLNKKSSRIARSSVKENTSSVSKEPRVSRTTLESSTENDLDISSQNSEETSTEIVSLGTRSTRNSVSARSTEIHSNHVSPSVSQSVGNSNRKNASTSLKAASGKMMHSADHSQSTYKSAVKEDLTLVRRSRRVLMSSQSTDSDSDATPGRLRKRISSAKKVAQKADSEKKRGQRK